MIHQVLLAVLLILLFIVHSQGQGSLVITRHPQNLTACVGDNVTITCGFDGLALLPNWILGNRTYGTRDISNSDQLYSPATNITNDTVLIIYSVTESFNRTTTQCEFQLSTPVYSSIGSLTIMGVPLTPSIVVTEVALNSFTVSWSAFSHSVCGDVLYNVTLFDEVQLIESNVTSGNNMSFTGLYNATQYEVTVFAVNMAGPGSAVSSNVTTLTPAVPFPPSDLVVNSGFVDYEPVLWISWNPPVLAANMTEVIVYNVTLIGASQQLSFESDQATFNLSAVHVKLNIRENYMIKVSAVNSVGLGGTVVTSFELQWLQSATISLSRDNETIIVSCEVAKSIPPVKCLAVLDCSTCKDPHTTLVFFDSAQFKAQPSKDYFVTVQAVGADNKTILEDYVFTKTLEIPKPEGIKGSPDDGGTSVLLYVVVVIAVLVVVAIILLITVICCCLVKKKSKMSVAFDEERSGVNGYTRHSGSSTPVPENNEKDQTDFQQFQGYSEIKVTDFKKAVEMDATLSPSLPTSIANSLKDESVTTSSVVISENSDSPVSLRQDSYAQVDLSKKHNKRNYVELAEFDTQRPTLIPLEVPPVQYAKVKFNSTDSKQDNSS